MFISTVVASRPNQEDRISTNVQIIDGRAIAAKIKQTLAKKVQKLSKDHNIRPGLAIVRVGDNPASQVYVASKRRQCEEIGVRSFEHHLPSLTKEEEIIALIKDINDDPEIHGMIVQLPLPKGLNKDRILQTISPDKDVDGLHALNMGRLVCGLDGFIPCTPKGCMTLIKSVKKDLKGMHAVVIGTSNLVGKPLAHLLQKQGCTITCINSKTKNPAELSRTADILVCATGVAHLVKEDWVKEGAIVLDVGINHLVDKDGTPYLVGDVDFQAVAPKAKAITPVPGGVGPMTVASLLENTIHAAENSVASQ